MAVHCRGQGLGLPGTAFADLVLARTDEPVSSHLVYMHPLDPALRAFTCELKGRKRGVGSGEKQGPKPHDDHIWAYSPLSFYGFQELSLESICGASPHTQVLTTHPPKEE